MQSTPKLPTKMLVLGFLYFSQGLPYGFFIQALPVLLRKLELTIGKAAEALDV